MGSFSEIYKAYEFSNSPYFYDFYLWENHTFLINDRPLEKHNFPLSKQIIHVGELFTPGCGTFLALNEINATFQCTMNWLNYAQLKSCVLAGAKKYGINLSNVNENFHPKQPILIKLARMQPKGCSNYYHLLRATEVLINTTASRELVWHTVLNSVLAVTFWDKCWRSLAHLTNVDFKMRWVQIQIHRHILPTNYSVNKYRPDVDPLCSFCAQSLESIYHLFWQCSKVQALWEHLKSLLIKENIVLTPRQGARKYITGHYGKTSKCDKNGQFHEISFSNFLSHFFSRCNDPQRIVSVFCIWGKG